MNEKTYSTVSNTTSRRGFLAASAAGAGGAVIAGSSITRGTHASGSDTVRIALIGCGGRGTAAAVQALSTSSAHVKLVAMADAFENRLVRSIRAIRKRCPNQVDVPKERQFVGFDAYQKAIDAGVDVVLLTTPPGFRPVMFEAAIKAGKHVFMEKPVAVDAPGVRRVLSASKEADRKGLSVGVGFHFRHEKNHKQCVNMIHDGILGEIMYMRAYYNTGGLWVCPRKPGQTEMEYQINNWYYFNWLSGDHIVEQHVYTLETINWLKGEVHPVRANGMGGRQVRIGKNYGEIFDHHANEFDYPDGSKLFSQCRQMHGCWSSGFVDHAHGTKGRADMKNYKDCEIHLHGKPPKIFGPGSDGYQEEHDDLFASIVAGKPYNEAPYNATATMTAILGRMATYSGRVVTWDEAFNSDLSLGPERLAWDAEPPVKPGPDGIYPCAIPGITKAW